MALDLARIAAVKAAYELVPFNTTIGLGSGRAVFALTDLIGERHKGKPPLRAVVASSKTAKHAEAAGIEIIELAGDVEVSAAFDGADEVDNDLALIKGGGAALLREKILIASAPKVVIMAEDAKKVDHLGETRLLPVEIVRFGWETTRERVLQVTRDATLRMDDQGQPVVTDEGHYLLDVSVPQGDIRELANRLKQTLGIVDHGLFIDLATEVILGHDDGTVTSLQKHR